MKSKPKSLRNIMSILAKISDAQLSYVHPLEMMKKFRSMLKMKAEIAEKSSRFCKK